MLLMEEADPDADEQAAVNVAVEAANVEAEDSAVVAADCQLMIYPERTQFPVRNEPRIKVFDFRSSTKRTQNGNGLKLKLYQQKNKSLYVISVIKPLKTISFAITVVKFIKALIHYLILRIQYG